MNDWQIPTHTIAVRVLTDAGEPLSGDLFYAGAAEADDAYREIRMLLNDERRFLPFRVDRGDGPRPKTFLCKAHIVRVRVDRTDDSSTDVEWDDEAPPRRFILSDGTRLDGRVGIPSPDTASRLVDKLNQCESFIPVVSDRSVDFVNRDHLVRAH